MNKKLTLKYALKHSECNSTDMSLIWRPVLQQKRPFKAVFNDSEDRKERNSVGSKKKKADVKCFGITN